MTAVGDPTEHDDVRVIRPDDSLEIIVPADPELSAILDRLEALSNEIDVEPIRRCIVELARAVDHQPLVERLDELTRVLTGPAGSRPFRALSAEIEKLQETVKRDVTDRLDGIATAFDAQAVARAIQRSQWPVIDRLDELAGKAEDGGAVSQAELLAGVAEARRAMDEVGQTVAPLVARLEAGAITSALEASSLSQKLDGLAAALEHVDIEVGTDMSRITIELVGIRDELAKLSIPGDLADLAASVGHLEPDGSSPALAQLQRVADSLHPPAVLHLLEELKSATDPTLVLAELKALRAAADLSPVLRELGQVPGRVAEGPLAARLDRLERVLSPSNLVRAVEELKGLADPAPVLERIEGLRRELPEVDLQPVVERLDRLDEVLAPAELLRRVDELKVLADPGVVLGRLEALKGEFPETDLQPVLERVEELKAIADPARVLERIEGLRSEFPETDLQPVVERLDRLEEVLASAELVRRVDELKVLADPGVVLGRLEALKGEFPETDLQPILEKLDRLEQVADQADLIRRVDEVKATAEPGEVLAELRKLRAMAEPTPVLERIDALVDQLPPTDIQPVVDRLDALQVSTDPTPVMQAIRVVRAAVSELQFDQVDLGKELRSVLTQMGDLKTLMDPAFVVHELAQIHAVVGDKPLTERLDELKAASDPTQVLEELRSLASAIDLQKLLYLVGSLPHTLDPAPVLAKLDDLAARVERLDSMDQRVDRLQEAVEQLPARIADQLGARDGASQAAVASDHRLAQEVAQLAGRVDALVSRMDTTHRAVSTASTAQAEHWQAEEAARLELTAQLAEMSERLVALRRRMTVRAST